MRIGSEAPKLRRNVLIHVLFDESKREPPGPDLAFLKYLPGAFTPNHIHTSWEFAWVLDGDYYENNVRLPVGTLVLSSPGSEHEMRSEHGCMLFAMRAVPVTQNPDSTTKQLYLPMQGLDEYVHGDGRKSVPNT